MTTHLEKLSKWEDRRKAMMKLRTEGKTYRAIGAQYGISAHRVRQIVCFQQRLDRKVEQNRAWAINHPDLDAPLESLELSSRTYNSLMRTGMKTTGQAVEFWRNKGKPRNFGPVSMQELEDKLTDKGYISAQA